MHLYTEKVKIPFELQGGFYFLTNYSGHLLLKLSKHFELVQLVISMELTAQQGKR